MDLLPPPFHLLPRPLQRWLSRGRFIVQLFKWILFYFLLYFVCTIIGMLILGIHFPTSYDESNLIYEKLRSKNGADSHVQQGNRVTTRDISFINLLDGNYTGCTGRNGSDLQICRTEHMSLLVVLPIISIVIFCGLCLVVLECLRYRRKRIAPFFIDPKAGSEQSFGPFLENNASPRTGDDEDDVERQMREVPRERSEHRFTLDGTIDGWTNWISKNHENQQKQTPKRYPPSPLTRLPRIPSLALPKATYATFRKVSGIGLENIDNNTLGSRLDMKGKGKAGPVV